MSNPNQQFQIVKVPRPPRSRQDLSHSFKYTCDFGLLIPNLLLEVLPGDAFKVRTEMFMRCQPMVFPIMHEIDVYQHYYYVPWYLIWKHWNKFIVIQENEGDGEDETPIPLPPYFTPTAAASVANSLFVKNTLWDYMGLPPITAASTDFPANPTGDTRLQLAPFIAYQLIYNAYYRDENLAPEIDLSMWQEYDGAAAFGNPGVPAEKAINDALKDLFTIRHRSWEKDIFTSALPKPQKGTPQGINIELGNLAAEVVLKEAALQSSVYQRLVNETEPIAGGYALGSNANNGREGDLTAGSINISENVGSVVPASNVWLDPHGTLEAQLPDARGNFSIEMLRFSEQVQLLKERLMRAGSRENEFIISEFGVYPDDLRMGRPQYLGGGKQNIVISEVLQQSQTVSGESALGEFAGHGISLGSEAAFKKSFTNYGFIIGIKSVRPRTAYGQGVPKLFTKFDRYDYGTPALSRIGEQPVRNGELYFDYKDGKNDQEFGYQPIYHDYRFVPSRIAGEMRDTLADFHLNRLFSSRPSLNKDFVEIDPADMYHIFSVTEGAAGQHLICEDYHHIKAVRRLPKYGNPTL